MNGMKRILSFPPGGSLWTGRVVILSGLIVLSILAGLGQAEDFTPVDSKPAEVIKAPKPAKPAWVVNAPPGAKITDEGWFAPKPKLDKPKLPKEITKAFVIPIREPIKSKTFKAIDRKILRCRGKGAQLVIIDMDTLGGEVIAAMDITRRIKDSLDDIYVVCYVRTRAISAGAMIAMSCDEIVMTPVGTIGDCAPIVMGGKLEGIEREKIESPLRTEFEESATRNGYNVPLSTSMVSYDQEVWLVRNKATRELRYVLAGEYRSKVSNPPNEIGGAMDIFKKGKGKWEFRQVILAEGKLLTMTPIKAVKFGFVSKLIKAPRDNPFGGLEQHFNIIARPVVLEDTWSEDLVDFLTSPVIAGLLFALMLLFGYIEMHTPGFGVFGTIAIACLVTLLCSQFLVGMANWWEIVVFGLGVILILLEIFVIPGFGFAGIGGIALCVLGLLAMLIPNAPDKFPWPTTTLGWTWFESSAFALCVAFVASVIIMGVLSKYLPKMTLLTKSKIILAPAMAADTSPRTDDSPVFKMQVGQIGQAVSMLRPVGQGRFDDELIDIVTEGPAIEAGRMVKILHIEGNRIVVEEIEIEVS
jgi:membrane-bound serine protease (ClpP class)